jgi:8-oxo-dGTP pyrophosphatase MutT (NUDIX family)
MTYAGAGFVVLSSDLQSILLVLDSRSNKWGFPKGHRESYDKDDLATAKRELFEETGILDTQYTVHMETFKIKKGSGSYIFRYAVLNEDERRVHLKPGPFYEIKGLAWVPVRELIDVVHVMDGNIYLRTWLDDMKLNTIKRSVTVYKSLPHILRPVHKSVGAHNIVTCT